MRIMTTILPPGNTSLSSFMIQIRISWGNVQVQVQEGTHLHWWSWSCCRQLPLLSKSANDDISKLNWWHLHFGVLLFGRWWHLQFQVWSITQCDQDPLTITWWKRKPGLHKRTHRSAWLSMGDCLASHWNKFVKLDLMRCCSFLTKFPTHIISAF